MSWHEAISIIEKYYNDMHSWSSDSNCSGYDLDVTWTKEQLETLIYYLQLGDLSFPYSYLSFLTELKKDIDEEIVVAAIRFIIETINENI